MDKSIEVTPPLYQEQKELWGSQKFDTLIVFGQGPVKPVLLESELTSEQRTVWSKFKKNPFKNQEPDFRVVEGEFYLSEFTEIEFQNDLSPEEKNAAKEKKRQEWQNLGRLALNRWGRQNALAAGLALYLGITDELILSGGKTVPGWAKKTLPTERLNNWPSEAKLMKDIIIRRFGDLYQQKYGRPIENAIKIEDGSTNTLENLAKTINKNPQLLEGNKKIGLLGADFHLRRLGILARLFSVKPAPRGEVSAQELLSERATIGKRDKYQAILNFMKDSLNNPELRNKLLGEETWERGLIDENWLAYWLGFLGEVKDVSVIQRVIDVLKDPNWVNQATAEFQRAGLNFEDFKDEDLTKLERESPQKLQQLIEGLLKLKGRLRVGPPVIKDKPAHFT